MNVGYVKGEYVLYRHQNRGLGTDINVGYVKGEYILHRHKDGG